MDENLIKKVWEKAIRVDGFDSDTIRKDCCGALILKTEFGNRNSNFGWEIDHVYPLSQGGDDNIDNLRPMQWENKTGAGFTTGTPWMKINPNLGEINVKTEEANPNSILNFYKKLIDFRKGNEIIRDGSYTEYFNSNKNVYCYKRQLGSKGYIIICNFKEKKVVLNVDTIPEARGAKLVFGSWDAQDGVLGDSILLKPYEGVIYEFGSSDEAAK